MPIVQADQINTAALSLGDSYCQQWPQRPPANRDPFYQARSLIFHADGAPGSVLFPDNSLNQLSGVAVGTATIQADASAFGGASLRVVQGSSSYVLFTKPSGSFLSPTTWSIEFWIQITNPTTGSSGNNYNTVVALGNGSAWQRVIGLDNSTLNVYGNVLGGPLGIGRHYVLICQDVSGRYAYLDGTRIYVNSSSALAANSQFVAGCIDEVTNSAVWSWGGMLDEVRLTDGICIAAGTTCPIPTAPFPNF